MRNVFLFIISINLLFTSCKKDDIPSKKEMIVGSWKIARNLNINDKNEVIYKSEDATGCSAQTTFELKQDRTFNYIGYCNGKKVKPGTYTYNESTKELVLNYNNGSSETFLVHSVTATELWFNFGEIDTGNENGNVYHIAVLTK